MRAERVVSMWRELSRLIRNLMMEDFQSISPRGLHEATLIVFKWRLRTRGPFLMFPVKFGEWIPRRDDVTLMLLLYSYPRALHNWVKSNPTANRIITFCWAPIRQLQQDTLKTLNFKFTLEQRLFYASHPIFRASSISSTRISWQAETKFSSEWFFLLYKHSFALNPKLPKQRRARRITREEHWNSNSFILQRSEQILREKQCGL